MEQAKYNVWSQGPWGKDYEIIVINLLYLFHPKKINKIKKYCAENKDF